MALFASYSLLNLILRDDAIQSILLKFLLSLATMALLAFTVIELNKKEENSYNTKDLSIKENFNIKAVTYLVATPEEFSSALTDEKIR
jgi:hypothetical protein